MAERRPLVRSLRPIPALDGLRGVAIFLVLVYHLLGPMGWVPGGFLGVDLFFALSGFLITSLLLREITNTDGFSVRRFYERRARRLLPALILLLVPATLIGAQRWAGQSNPDVLVGVLAAATYWFNWLSVSGYDVVPLLHMWSLSVEEQYYLLWPFVLLLALRSRLRAGWILAGTLVLAAASAIARAMSVYVEAPDRFSYSATPLRLDVILLGSGLAMVFAWYRADRLTLLAGWGAIPAVLGLALLVRVLRQHGNTTFIWGIAAAGLCSAVLLACVTLGPTGAASRRVHACLAHPAVTWLGRRSYALYLFAWPVQCLSPGGPIIAGLVTIAVCLPLVELSYRYVERPVLERRFLASIKALGGRARAVARAWVGMGRQVPES